MKPTLEQESSHACGCRMGGCELRGCVRRGELSKVKDQLKNGADYAAAGDTMRGWTPLHIACWGSLKPQVHLLRRKRGQQQRAAEERSREQESRGAGEQDSTRAGEGRE